ncbi:Glycoside hydrolase family 61 protein [Pyrenophora tritici-repentis]|nr:Glycoside hydrolase family 61 protein [Pyrenophora tritici-repentis]
MARTTALLLSLLAGQTCAHTFIWGVFVNGIDQGTFRGIRIPAYNGPFGRGGYNNSPVKDLASIDMRCNVLGDLQAHDTIKVNPGDNLTLDWHHETRSDADDVIASSHHGPSMVYISSDPPTNDSFVKIWHEGKYQANPFPQPGLWSTTSDVAKRAGHMNVRVPAGLKAGFYLIRAEMVGLHEADVSFAQNPRRGAQFYPDCVQIEVVGDGDVELPRGVGFPGAYSYEDPGVVHNVYCSTETVKPRSSTTSCVTDYVIPGPTVWSGAWPETTAMSVGPVKGVTTATAWSTWIGTDSMVTSATYSDVKSQTIVGTSKYTASWSKAYATPPATAARW